jgi:CRP-like cAMP-binding protein
LIGLNINFHEPSALSIKAPEFAIIKNSLQPRNFWPISYVFKNHNYIKHRIEISDEDISEGLKYSTFKKYLKGEYILRIGEYRRFIGFINKGIMVTTTIDDNGKESAFDFKH